MSFHIETTTDTDAIAQILRVLRSGIDERLINPRLGNALKAGYRAILAENGKGLLGYHITEDVYWGKTFYIDDLVVLPELRNSGIGAALIAHAKQEAQDQSCDHIRLCSGLSRADAHRFYESVGFSRSSLQFSFALSESKT